MHRRKLVKLTKDFEEELKCNICLEIFTEPTHLPCEHRFCWECVEAILENEAKCPMCAIPFYRRDAKHDALAGSLVGILKRLKTCVETLEDDDDFWTRGGGPKSQQQEQEELLRLSSQQRKLERVRLEKVAELNARKLAGQHLAPSPCSKVVLLTSGMTEEQKKEAKKAVSVCGGRLVDKFTKNVTHCVVSCDVDGMARRTEKLLVSVLHNCWCLSSEWIKKSQSQRHWVEEQPFVVQGDSCFKGGYQKAADVGERATLFSDLEFVLRGTFRQPPLAFFKKIIRTGGGKLRDTPLSAAEERRDKQLVVLVGSLEADDRFFVKELLCEFDQYPLRADWCLDAVSRYSIEDQDLYDTYVLGYEDEDPVVVDGNARLNLNLSVSEQSSE